MMKKFFGAAVVLTTLGASITSALQLEIEYPSFLEDADDGVLRPSPDSEDKYVKPHDYTRGLLKYREVAEEMEKLM